MTTHRTTYTEANAPPILESTTDERPSMDAIAASVPELKVKFRQIVENGKSRMSAWKGGVQAGIREKPIQSVLIAAAIGAAIGVIVGRRSR